MKRLIQLAAAFMLPLAALAATYSTDGADASAGAYTPNAGNGNANWQAFNLGKAVTAGSGEHFLFVDASDHIAATTNLLQLDSIKVTWGSGTDNNAIIGKTNVDQQPTPYLVVTTTNNVIMGISAAPESGWVADGTSTFAFTGVLLATNARYRFQFATDVSALSVGDVFSGAVAARCNMKYHFSSTSSISDEDVASSASATYSVNAQINVSEAVLGEELVLEPTAEGVALVTGNRPVVVRNGVAGGIGIHLLI